jgi:hypothetical protein
VIISGSLLETDIENLTNNELENLLLFGPENLTESEDEEEEVEEKESAKRF